VLRLTEAIHTEPFLISHLVRIAMLQIMLQPVWEGLAEHRWSEEQLVALDAKLMKLDFLADYKLSMRVNLHITTLPLKIGIGIQNRYSFIPVIMTMVALCLSLRELPGD